MFQLQIWYALASIVYHLASSMKAAHGGQRACDTDVWDYFLRQGSFLVRQGCVVLDSNPWLPIYMRFVQLGFLSCSLSDRVAFA